MAKRKVGKIARLCGFTLLLLAAAVGRAQRLTVEPGLATLYAGDPTGQLNNGQESPVNYVGAPGNLLLGNGGGGILVFDNAGNLYMSTGAGDIRVVAAGGPIPALPSVANPQANTVYTLAGTGTGSDGTTIPCSNAGADIYGNGCPATKAFIGGTSGLAVDASGNVYVGDGGNDQIRVIYGGSSTALPPNLPTNAQRGFIYALANSAGFSDYGLAGDGGPALAAELSLSAPATLAVDAQGDIYIADSSNYAIRIIYSAAGVPAGRTAGNIYTFAGMLGSSCLEQSLSCDDGDGGSATSASLSNNLSVSLDASGNVYIGDGGFFLLRAVYASGTLAGIKNPVGGNIYAIAGNETYRPGIDGAAATAYGISSPGQVAIDKAGGIYFPDILNNVVLRVDPDDTIKVAVGGAVNTGTINLTCASDTDTDGDGCAATQSIFYSGLSSVALDSSGNIYSSGNVGGTIIRETLVDTSRASFAGTVGLPTPNQVVNIRNTGSAALQISGISVPAPYSQTPTGGTTDCGSSTSLAPDGLCQIGFGFATSTEGAPPGNPVATITSNAQNAVGGVNQVLLSGVAAKGETITDVSISQPFASAGQQVTFTATVLPPFGDTVTPTGVGTLGTSGYVDGVAATSAAERAARHRL